MENTTAMHPAAALVQRFLAATMSGELEVASGLMAADARITFTGGRIMHSPAEIAAFNRQRYLRVSKRQDQFHWVEDGDRVVVYARGILFGTWPDGRDFTHNRYLDCFEVCDGKIVAMDVWNDSAEWLLCEQLNQSA